jgi:hypothetical protein
MADPKSIDERLEFLLQSTESLHASLQELHAIAAENTRQMEKQARYTQRDRRQIRLLREVMAIHELRIRGLEKGSPSEEGS